MKPKYLLLILLSTAFFGCYNPVINIKLDCNMPTAELFQILTEELEKEGMKVTIKDINAGYLKADSKEDDRFYRNWIIQIEGGKIIANAKIQGRTRAVGSTMYGHTSGDQANDVYYDDTADNGQKWYWNIRNKLGTLCNSKITFEEK